MDVPLWECDDDRCLTEELVDPETDVTADSTQVHHRFHFCPEIDLKDQGIVPEFLELYDRFRLWKHLRMLVHSLPDQLCHLVGW